MKKIGRLYSLCHQVDLNIPANHLFESQIWSDSGRNGTLESVDDDYDFLEKHGRKPRGVHDLEELKATSLRTGCEETDIP